VAVWNRRGRKSSSSIPDAADKTERIS
jgi:hypothetical protein